MAREDIIKACANAICDMIDPYELDDQGATDGDAFAEAVHLLETDPAALVAWLAEF